LEQSVNEKQTMNEKNSDFITTTKIT
jgi:hypothetical protein